MNKPRYIEEGEDPALQPGEVLVRQFANHYHCEPCGEEWEDEWCCACNDKCPTCNAEIEPEESEVIDTFALRLEETTCPVCDSTHEF